MTTMNMLNQMIRFNNLGVGTAEALIPDHGDFEQWAVLACDQYTTDEAYWNRVAKRVGDDPSTLNIVYPEIYLQNDDEKTQNEKIQKIIDNTHKYFGEVYEEVSEKRSDGFIYVKRQTSTGTRKGIILCLDLKMVGTDGKFRPSEAVIEERMLVRKKIREGAAIETPHILMFADDKEGILFRDLEKLERDKPLYDFELMENGGNVKGWFAGGEMVFSVTDAIEELQKERNFCLTVGDGNHALMAAKMHYDQMAKEFDEDILRNHPLRYVMVEVVNIYDESIKFSPINKVLMEINPKEVLDKILANVPGAKFNEGGSGQIQIVSNDFCGGLECDDLFALQKQIEELACRVDYINDENAATELGKQNGNITFLMPVVKKEELFDIIEKNGMLPKKSFSMGDANDKRFYFETRRIIM